VYSVRRHWAAVAALLFLFALSAPARAWIETSIKSDSVVLDLERDGSATVSHEILLVVRGGPLKGFELAGADADAEPLPDATVTRAQSGGNGSSVWPLSVGKQDDGTLALRIDEGKGLPHGTYLFKVRYRTNLAKRGLVTSHGPVLGVRWVGPRLPDGVDAAQVVFRLPPAPTAPRVSGPSPHESSGETDSQGVFLSNLRRASDKDELELVRPHVAKGEPVLWQIELDARALQGFAPAALPQPAGPADPAASALRARLVWATTGLLLAILYGVLVLNKWNALSRVCTIRQARPIPLVPLPAALRAALAGAALGGALVVAKLTEAPTLGAALLVTAMALGTHLAPRPETRLRGPGRWLPLTDQEAFQSRRLPVPGRWLDAGTLPGLFLFVLTLAGLSAGALWVLSRSTYDALLLGLGTAALLPIFLTARTSELAEDPVTRPARLLSRLALRLRQRDRFKVVAWARIPDKNSDPDELRLLIVPRPPAPGLVAIEIATESTCDPGTMLPCVLVRVLDGSRSQACLGRSVEWMRGRKAEERVALLRPKLPTFGLTLALVERVASLLTDRRPGIRRPRQPEIKTPIPGGRADSTAKLATARSPAQAT
jgi:hypothetical protein